MDQSTDQQQRSRQGQGQGQQQPQRGDSENPRVDYLERLNTSGHRAGLLQGARADAALYCCLHCRYRVVQGCVVLFNELLLAPLESLIFTVQLVGEVLDLWRGLRLLLPLLPLVCAHGMPFLLLLLCQRLHILQLSHMLVLFLMVLQVCLSCILRGVEHAEMGVEAGCCLAFSLVPAMVRTHPRYNLTWLSPTG